MTLTPMQLGLILVVVAAAGGLFSEIGKYSIRKFLKKTVDTEYATADQCRLHRQEVSRRIDGLSAKVETRDNEIIKRLDALKGIIVVIAIKNNVSDDDIRRIVEG